MATPADVPELVRLRRFLADVPGLRLASGDWESGCAALLTDWLRSGTGCAAVADSGSGLVACGVASIDQRLPGPSNVTGQYGYIASMATEPAYRGQGLARQVLQLLLDWFESVGVGIVDLHASAQGEPIYRSFGFVENPQVALRWRSR